MRGKRSNRQTHRKKNFYRHMELDCLETEVDFDGCVMCHGSSFELIERVRKCIEKSKDLSIKPQKDGLDGKETI